MRNTVHPCGSTATTTGRPCENLTTDRRGCHLHRNGAGTSLGGGQPIGLPPVSAVQDDLSGAEVAELESENDAMRDEDFEVRRAVAAGDPNALKSAMMAALRDEDAGVRLAAAKNLNRDEDWDVRRAVAAGDPNALKSAMMAALRDEDAGVRRAVAAGDPNAPKR